MKRIICIVLLMFAGNALFADSGDDNKLLYAMPFTLAQGEYKLYGKESRIYKLITRIESEEDRSAEESIDLGYAYFIIGENKKAVSEFERAIKAGNVNPKSYNMIAGIYLRDKHNKEAELYYRKTLEKYPDNETALYNISEILFDRGKFTEAKKLINQILSGNETYYDAHQLLGLIAEKEKRFNDAEKLFRREIELYESSPVSHRHLAELIAKRKGNLDEIIHHYRMALNTSPYNTDVRKLIIAAYQKKGGDSVEIADSEKKLLGLTAQDATLYNYAMLFLHKESTKDDYLFAIKVLEEQLKLYPGYLSANLNIGSIYSRLGDNDKAYDYFLNEMKLNMNNPSLVYNIAFYFLGKVDKSTTREEQASNLAIAKVFFHRCVLIDPLDKSAAEYEAKIDAFISGK